MGLSLLLALWAALIRYPREVGIKIPPFESSHPDKVERKTFEQKFGGFVFLYSSGACTVTSVRRQDVRLRMWFCARLCNLAKGAAWMGVAKQARLRSSQSSHPPQTIHPPPKKNSTRKSGAVNIYLKNLLATPRLAVEGAVGDSLGYVGGVDALLAGQVGNRAGNLNDTIVCACREVELSHGPLEECS